MDIVQRVVPSGVDIEGEGVPGWLGRLYAARGVACADDIARPLPELPGTQAMANLQAMAVELVALRERGKRVVIVGDYDCDGAAASAVMFRGLSQLGFDVAYLVPKRLEHGYGLTPEVVRQAHAMSPDALVTVDCGISSFEGVREARRLGMPVFVTDHHLQGDSLPEAELIVNPNQLACGFPTKALCGAGVAFYLIRAIRELLMARGASHASLPSVAPLLGWVALATIADVVPLDVVNRSLVFHGLRILRKGGAGPGMQALIDVSKRSVPYLSTQDLAFSLGPRINAAGRMATMDAGVQLLLDGGASASGLAHELDSLNRSRREVEGDMAAEAALQADALMAEPGKRTLVVCHEGWHEGVVGIVAGRLKEKHWRPTIVLAPTESGDFKGSARSIPGLHLRDCLARVDQLYPGVLKKFGGHAAAAGLTVQSGQQRVFAEAFEAVARELLSEEDLKKVTYVDGPLPAEALSIHGARALNDGLWGQGMPAPLFMDELEIRSALVLKDKATGEPKHLKLQVSAQGAQMDAIWFNQATVPANKRFPALFTLGLNEYKGLVSAQVLVQGAPGVT